MVTAITPTSKGKEETVQGSESILLRIHVRLSLWGFFLLVGSDSYGCVSSLWLRLSTQIWEQLTVSVDLEQS